MPEEWHNTRETGIITLLLARFGESHPLPMYGHHLMKHINALEEVQKHFTKRSPSLSYLSYHELLAALDLEPSEIRGLKSELVLYYKCLHDLVALPISEYFTISNCTSQTRTGGTRLLRSLLD